MSADFGTPTLVYENEQWKIESSMEASLKRPALIETLKNDDEASMLRGAVTKVEP
jgi:hypothetical protein